MARLRGSWELISRSFSSWSMLPYEASDFKINNRILLIKKICLQKLSLKRKFGYYNALKTHIPLMSAWCSERVFARQIRRNTVAITVFYLDDRRRPPYSKRANCRGFCSWLRRCVVTEWARRRHARKTPAPTTHPYSRPVRNDETTGRRISRSSLNILFLPYALGIR